MERGRNSGADADTERADAGDRSGHAPESTDGLDERIRAAREKRGNTLLAKGGPADRGGAAAGQPAPHPGESFSLQSRIEAARAARLLVLAERHTRADAARTSDSGVPLLREPPEVPARDVTLDLKRAAQATVPPVAPESIGRTLYRNAGPAHPTTETGAARSAPRATVVRRFGADRAFAALCGALAGSAALAALAVFWIVSDPIGDAPLQEPSEVSRSGVGFDYVEVSRKDPAAFATGLDLLVIAEDGIEIAGDQFGDAPYELRLTPFEISRSTVEYFNASDAKAAAELAERMGADIIDLQGIQPAPPPGRVLLYLSPEDA